jgi:muramoyltetrapeptide carboxypeptidase
MILRGPVLRPGDAVALVSPSGPAPADRIALGVAMFESWGLKVVPPEPLTERGYLAGDDRARLAGINAAIDDPAVRAIVCTRGGYGAQRLVDGVDYAGLARDPKPLVGFSDITALQLAAHQRIGLAGVHAPMAAWNAERTGTVSAESLRAALMSTADAVVEARVEEETSPLRIGGVATGPLVGGNLCLLASSVGTPDHPRLDGAILLLEEVEEPPYKVDRMLVQLRRAGLLERVAGVAVGQFTDCADGWPTTVVEVLAELLGDLGVPVLGGLPVGHGRDQMSVPIGTTVTLDAATGTLTATSAVRST